MLNNILVLPLKFFHSHKLDKKMNFPAYNNYIKVHQLLKYCVGFGSGSGGATMPQPSERVNNVAQGVRPSLEGSRLGNQKSFHNSSPS